MDDYSERCAKEVENMILRIGPDKVCGFVGETILGSLVGDVPALKGYWSGISKICEKYVKQYIH